MEKTWSFGLFNRKELSQPEPNLTQSNDDFHNYFFCKPMKMYRSYIHYRDVYSPKVPVPVLHAPEDHAAAMLMGWRVRGSTFCNCSRRNKSDMGITLNLFAMSINDSYACGIR